MRVETNKWANRTIRRSAFTLMEVLVVVAILVVLAGVGGVIYIRVQEDAYRDMARLQAKEIETAVRSYMRSHNNEPPATLQEVVTPSDGGKGYIEPQKLLDPWQMPYGYRAQPTTPQNQNREVPDIYSFGPNKADDGGSNDDIGNW